MSYFKFAYIDNGKDPGAVRLFSLPQQGEKLGTAKIKILKWGKNSDLYYAVKGKLIAVSQSTRDNIVALEQAGVAAKEAEVDKITAAKKDNGLQSITLEQAESWISGKFDTDALQAAINKVNSASNVAEVKAELVGALLEVKSMFDNARQVHLKELPYIIGDD